MAHATKASDIAEQEKLAARIVDDEPYKVKDLWLDLEVMSPVGIPGSYSITVALYDGGEPVQAAGSSGGVRVQSEYKVRHTQWKLTLRHSFLVMSCCYEGPDRSY